MKSWYKKQCISASVLDSVPVIRWKKWCQVVVTSQLRATKFCVTKFQVNGHLWRRYDELCDSWQVTTAQSWSSGFTWASLVIWFWSGPQKGLHRKRSGPNHTGRPVRPANQEAALPTIRAKTELFAAGVCTTPFSILISYKLHPTTGNLVRRQITMIPPLVMVLWIKKLNYLIWIPIKICGRDIKTDESKGEKKNCQLYERAKFEKTSRVLLGRRCILIEKTSCVYFIRVYILERQRLYHDVVLIECPFL
jgi:hypothetical protein